MQHFSALYIISLSFFVVPLLGSSIAMNEREIHHLPDREVSKKSLIFVEFPMNPYDPLARATDKVWNKLFKPIFNRLEDPVVVNSPLESSTITQPTHSTIVSLRPRPDATTTTTPTTTTTKAPKTPGYPAQQDPTMNNNQSSSSNHPTTTTPSPDNSPQSQPPNNTSSSIDIMLPFNNSSSSPTTPTASPSSPSTNTTSPVSATQLLNCIDWLLDWLQSNSLAPLRSSEFQKTRTLSS